MIYYQKEEVYKTINQLVLINKIFKTTISINLMKIRLFIKLMNKFHYKVHLSELLLIQLLIDSQDNQILLCMKKQLGLKGLNQNRLLFKDKIYEILSNKLINKMTYNKIKDNLFIVNHIQLLEMGKLILRGKMIKQHKYNKNYKI